MNSVPFNTLFCYLVLLRVKCMGWQEGFDKVWHVCRNTQKILKVAAVDMV